MKHWMQDFLEQSLRAIPDGAYRKRMEAELTDHLAALSEDLQAAGWPEQEARAAALERMGDPTELACSYEARWRESLHSPRRRAVRMGRFLNMVCYLIWMAIVGALYLVNAPNFGKSVVGIYGLAAIPMAVFLLVLLVVAKHDMGWKILRMGCWAYGLMQLPPLVCWLYFVDCSFELSGVIFNGGAGLMLHMLILVWSLCNGYALERMKFRAAV